MSKTRFPAFILTGDGARYEEAKQAIDDELQDLAPEVAELRGSVAAAAEEHAQQAHAPQSHVMSTVLEPGPGERVCQTDLQKNKIVLHAPRGAKPLSHARFAVKTLSVPLFCPAFHGLRG